MGKDIKLIDCFGDICPVPMIKIENELMNMSSGDAFILVTDHSCTLASIKDKYIKRNVDISITEPMNGVWEIYFKKR